MQENKTLIAMGLGAVIAIALAAPCRAGLASRASLTTIAAPSDAIVAGSADASRSSGTVRATVTVERSLKGELSQGSSLAILWRDPQAGVPDEHLPKGAGLFFLSKARNGGWALLPFTTGDAGWRDVYIQLSESDSGSARTTIVSPQSPAVIDKVLAELANAALSGMRPPVDFIDGYRATRSRTLEYAFRQFLDSPDSITAAIGLCGSVSMGDSIAIGRLHAQALSGSSVPFWSSIIQELKSSYSSSDSASIADLAAVVADTKAPQELRSAAAWALARLHVPAALPCLARFLDDPDLGIEAAGVGGLSSFANNVPIGLHEPASGAWKFRTDATIAHSAFDESIVTARRSFYVGFWKTWWAENQFKVQN